MRNRYPNVGSAALGWGAPRLQQWGHDMPRMLTALSATVSLCVISQLYSVDAAPKAKTDGVVVLDRNEIMAAKRKADEVGKVQQFRYYTSADGVKRQEIQPPGTSDRAPASPSAPPTGKSF
jgi:hypothetical protein